MDPFSSSRSFKDDVDEEIMMLRTPRAATSSTPKNMMSSSLVMRDDDEGMQLRSPMAVAKQNNLMDMSMDSSEDGDMPDERRHDDDISAMTMDHEDIVVDVVAAAAARDDVPFDNDDCQKQHKVDEDIILLTRSYAAGGAPPITPSAVTKTEHRRKMDLMEECGEIEVEYFSAEESHDDNDEDIISTVPSPADDNDAADGIETTSHVSHKDDNVSVTGVPSDEADVADKTIEKFDNASTYIPQSEVVWENPTWSFDTALKTKKKTEKKTVETDDRQDTPIDTTDDIGAVIKEEEIEEETSNHVRELEQSDLAHCQDNGDAAPEDADDSNTVYENAETEMGGNDFDSLLENVGEYIESRNWDQVIDTVKSHPSLAVLSSADFFPAADASVVSGFIDVDSEKNLLLHEICKNAPSLDVIKEVLSLHEIAIKLPGQWGHLPLHHACASGSSVSVVKHLLEVYPEAALITSDRSMLPLHIACKNNAPLEVIKILIMMNRSGVNVKDAESKTPLDYCMCLDEGPDRDEMKKLLQEAIEHSSRSAPVASIDQGGSSSNVSDRSQELEESLTRELEKVAEAEAKVADLEKWLAEALDQAKMLQSALKEESEKCNTAEQVRIEAESHITVIQEALEHEVERSNSLQTELDEERQKLESAESTLSATLSKVEQTADTVDAVVLMARQKIYEKTDIQFGRAHQYLLKLEKNLRAEEVNRLLERQQLHNKTDLHLAKAHQIVVESEMKLEMKDNRIAELESKLKEMHREVTDERDKNKQFLAQLEQSKTTIVEKVKDLEDELSHSRSLCETQCREIVDLQSNLQRTQSDEGKDICDKEQRISHEESLVKQLKAKIAEKKRLLEEDKELIQTLEKSNALKQKLLEEQQKKIEAIERSRREKEKQLTQNQQIMKELEQVIEQKEALEKIEANKLAALESARAARKTSIDVEEDQIKELDYNLARKQALIELEQMKEKTLQQTIAQKNELIDSEVARIKELELIIADKQLQLMAERKATQALEAAKAEKESVLAAERKIVEQTRRLVQEKEDLLEKERKAGELIQQRVLENEAMLSSERQLIQDMKRAQMVKESALAIQKATLEEMERHASQQKYLLEKEEHVTQALELFTARKNKILATGPSTHMVHVAISMKYTVRRLLKENLLASTFEKIYIRERSAVRSISAVMARTSPSKVYNSFIVGGSDYLRSKLSNALGIRPSQLLYLTAKSHQGSSKTVKTHDVDCDNNGDSEKSEGSFLNHLD